MMRVGALTLVVAALTSGCNNHHPPEPEELAMTTGGWRFGQPGQDAGLDRVLVLDERDCVQLQVSDGLTASRATTLRIVWPAGYYALRSSVGDGPFRVHNSEGEVVANEGDNVYGGGGLQDAQTVQSVAGAECLPSSGEVFVVQSEVHQGSLDDIGAD